MEISVSDLRSLIGEIVAGVVAGQHGKHSYQPNVVRMDDEVAVSAPDVIGGVLPFHIGQKLFIRTVTYHITGEVTAIGGGFLTLKDAAWIADSGRFADALEKSQFDEVEPYPKPAYVAIGAITDATEIDTLPRVQT